MKKFHNLWTSYINLNALYYIYHIMSQLKEITLCINFDKTIVVYMSVIGCHKSKKEDKDQKSIQSSTTLDQGYQWESDNFTTRHHKREPRGQAFPSR